MAGPEKGSASAARAVAAAGPVLGRLVAGSTAARPLVAVVGQSDARPAISTVPLDAAAVAAAVASGQRVLLLFEENDPARPIIIGLVQTPSETPMLDELLGDHVHEVTLAPAASAAETPPMEAEVDGRRVVIEARDELVLRCGRASITLRRNGKVLIRGDYVETYADGTNRVKGATVKIN
jgi:hypothetical protein